MADVESASHSSSQSFPAGVGFSSIGAVSSAMVQETPTHSRSLRHYASTPLQKGYEREMSNTDVSNDSHSNGGEDINIEASLPADHRSGVLPHQPVNRVTPSPEYTEPGIPKSSSTTRMPFIRRQKRAESSFGRGKKPGREVDPFGDEIEDSREKHFEDTSTSYGFDANSTLNSRSYSQRRTIDEDGDTMADASVMTAAPPEAALKKRPTRIERNFTEQIAWLRRKFDLGQSEELLDSCSAALVQKIMLQGRLYIMTSCICFYAKIFGRVTKEQWSYSAIASVRKRGGFFANSIKILFNGEVQPVILASLNRREQTLALILTRLSVFSPSAELRSRRNSDSEDHSADDVYSRDPNQAFPRCRSDRSNSSSQQPSLSDNAPSRNSADGNTPFRYARAGSDTASEDIPHASSNAVENGCVRSKPPNAEVRGGVSDSIQARLDQLVWAKPGDPMDHVVGKEYEKRTEQARGVLEAPVCVAFNEILFTDFFDKYHEDVNNIDVQPTDWTKDGDGIMTREVSFRRPLAFRIGPKETRVKEMQRFCYTSDGGVLMETKAHNLDVPYADYFVVETFFEFKPLKNGLACELKASVAVHFAKNTMLRSKIESGTLSETKITFGRLVEMAEAHVRDPAVKRLSDAYLKSKQKKNKGRPRGTKPAPRPPPQTTSIEAQATSKPHRNSAVSKSEKKDADQTANEPAANATQPVVNTNRSLPASDRTFAAARENQSSEILRIVVVIALVTACILLFMALLSFHRMQHKIEGLEAFVREVQKANAARAEATTCAK